MVKVIFDIKLSYFFANFSRMLRIDALTDDYERILRCSGFFENVYIRLKYTINNLKTTHLLRVYTYFDILSSNNNNLHHFMFVYFSSLIFNLKI